MTLTRPLCSFLLRAWVNGLVALQFGAVSGRTALSQAVHDRDADRARLEEVLATGTAKVTTELLAIREIWIEVFGNEAFDLGRLKQKFASLEQEIVESEQQLQDAVSELRAIRERSIAAESEFDRNLHDLQATLAADADEVKTLVREQAEATKAHAKLQKEIQLRTVQLDDAQAQLDQAGPKLE